ncbi:MAG: hypothetical protein RL563_1524 [Pseudomonadota bacterium]
MSHSVCSACLMLNAGFDVCPHCGWESGVTPNNPQHLLPGTLLQPPYQVARVLGHGGFGITYLGWDANLQIKVAIKEFLPRAFAQRDSQTGYVNPYANEAVHYFEMGLKHFIEEARILAKFQQHPGIVSVFGFFRAFGTGYIVMEYVEGETLKNYVSRGIGRLNWQQTLDVFLQVMDALRAVHQVGLLHRDIAPDNVYLCNDGRVKLLDFGEARYVMVAQTQSLVVVKPGFAAEEQFRNNATLGPWTDVYGLAACMYYCLTGQAPPNVTERLVQDCLKPPHECGIVMPDDAERALLLALSIRACHRPQSVAAFQQLLMAEVKVTEIKNELPPTQKSSLFEPSLSLSLISDPISNQKRPFFSWRRWLMFAMVTLTLLVFLYRLVSQLRPILPLSEMSGSQINEVSNPNQTHSDGSFIDWDQQRQRERENADALRLQQEAALKRFEEYRNQSTLANDRQLPQSDQHRIEHWQRLCEEWGATMDCPKEIWEK